MQEAPYKIYNASAGSGKTFTLVKAYLKILLAGHSNKKFRQILAITFTNKAVNEMKQRILQSLHDFSKTETLDTASDLFKLLAKELDVSTATLKAKARKTLLEILHNYAYFDVSTIDKFTHRLIRTFAKDLKLPQNFEVLLDTDLLLAEAVARLINKAGEDKELTAVLLEFALEKIDGDKSWNISLDLQKIGKLLFNENQLVHLQKFEDKKIVDFLALKQLLKKQGILLEKEIRDDAQRIIQLIDEHGLEFSDFKSGWFPKFVLKIRDGDLKVDYNAAWKQNFDKDPLYSKSCPDTTKAILDQLHPQFVALFQKIRTAIYQLYFAKNSYQNMVPLTVLSAIQQEINTLTKEQDQLPISSFNTLISNQIKDQPAPYIYERLGEKYRHYFLDEFQDTSQMQWANLVPLISNALESENEQGKKGTLLLVGDAKQAIYRWRGGKAEQFLDLIREKTNPFFVPPSITSLPQNFRSHAEIIQFNNSFFSSTSSFLANEAYHHLFIEGNQQKSNSKSGGHVAISFINKEEEKSEDQLYGEKVLQKIRVLETANHPLKDICILTRKRKHSIALAAFLMQHQVPVISSETLLLQTSPKVIFLINLLQHTIQPDDLETNYNLLHFLGKEKENPHDFIQKHLHTMNAFFIEAYHFKIDLLRQTSVFDGLEYAIRQFQLITDSDAHLTFLMDTVLDVEQKEGTGIQSFLNHWNKKKERLSIAAPEEMNAVQLMTIHKAKGLEFPIVIFPYANSNIYEEIDPKLWLPVDRTLFNDFEEVLISKKQEVLEYGALAADLYLKEHHKLELDAFNLLYVALTRAIKALFIISVKEIDKNGNANPKKYGGLFIHFLQEKGLWEKDTWNYTFGSLEPKLEKNTYKEEPAIPYLNSFKDRPGFNILTKSGMLWESDRAQAISKGNLIHLAMSDIATESDVEKALKTLRRNGDLSEEEIDFVSEKIRQIIRHPDLKLFFSSKALIKNEQDIITQNGLILRPDRMVFFDHRVSLIDYKTGSTSTTYHHQLNTYAAALEAMGYLVENKILVYINEKITPEFI